MAKIRTGFKICSRSRVDGGHKSAFSFGRVLKYETQIWTYQPEGCGPLAVFERLSDANEFIAHNWTLTGTSDVFLCEYEESDEHELYDDIGNRFSMTLPHGTALARRVKLIKKLRKL